MFQLLDVGGHMRLSPEIEFHVAPARARAAQLLPNPLDPGGVDVMIEVNEERASAAWPISFPFFSWTVNGVTTLSWSRARPRAGNDNRAMDQRVRCSRRPRGIPARRSEHRDPRPGRGGRATPPRYEMSRSGRTIRFGSVRYGDAHRDVVLGAACSHLLRSLLPGQRTAGRDWTSASIRPPGSATHCSKGYRCAPGTYRSRAAVAAAR